MKRFNAVFSLVLLVLCSQAAFAGLYHVDIDLSALGGSGFRLRVDLYSPAVTGSSVWMDNVVVGLINDDFEDGTLGLFNNSLNPASVNPVLGRLDGTGFYVMQIDEDLVFNPTVVYRDYPGGNALSFDFETHVSPTTGTFDDEFAISIVDSGWNPLVVGLTTDPVLGNLGDVLAVNAGGFQCTGEVDVTVVPAPAALLLGLLGFGASGLGLWRERKHLV